MFVHTGSHETFCQAAQEAKASGVPVVAPAAGGLLDVVDDGHTGLHFTPDSPSALANRVATLIADGERRVAMGAAARRSVAGCGWSAIGDELIGHYHDVRGFGVAQARVGALRSRTVLARRAQLHRVAVDRYVRDSGRDGAYHNDDGSIR